MRKSLQGILLLKSFATGAVAPVLTLMLLSHGANLSTVSLMLGVYSLTVIAAEFPSGLLADLRGRKNAFILSTLLYAGCYALLLFAQGPGLLAAAMALNGLGRAFSSGSLDALAMDEAADAPALVRVSARLSVLESAGLALGALAGGALATVGSLYEANIVLNLGLYGLMGLLTLLLVAEAPRSNPSVPVGAARSPRVPALLGQARDSFRFAARPGEVRWLLILTVATGFALLPVETYWQPALSGFKPAAWTFGLVSFAGYGSIIIGSKLAEKWFARRLHAGFPALLGLKALLGAGLGLLALAQGQGVFAAGYLALYLLLGGGSVAENALLNREAPSALRASILSLFSFALQAGGLLGSLCGYLLTARVGFHALWWVGAALLAAAAGAALLSQKKAQSRAHAAMEASDAIAPSAGYGAAAGTAPLETAAGSQPNAR